MKTIDRKGDPDKKDLYRPFLCRQREPAGPACARIKEILRPEGREEVREPAMKVYLDNAATSLVKPPEVPEAMMEYMREVNANPGRGGYELSLEAGRRMYGVRETLAGFFGADHPEQVVFSQNVTLALNQAIKGLVRPGDHVVISAMEHNAVFRPVWKLREKGIIDFSVIPADSRGITDPEDFLRLLRPDTRLLVVSHASNVCGSIFPLREVAEMARARDILVVADTAQTAGVLPVSLNGDSLDVLAFTGHKHLLGPTGTGGMVVGPRALSRMETLIEGGTGSLSHRPEQPDFLPDMLECGTLNTVGLAGLEAGVRWLQGRPPGLERQWEMEVAGRLLESLMALPQLEIYGPRDMRLQTGTIAFNIRGVDNGELCQVLDSEFGVMGRTGLHCSPLGHETLGTLPEGCMRFSTGAFTTMEEVEYTLNAVRELVKLVI